MSLLLKSKFNTLAGLKAPTSTNGGSLIIDMTTVTSYIKDAMKFVVTDKGAIDISKTIAYLLLIVRPKGSEQKDVTEQDVRAAEKYIGIALIRYNAHIAFEQAGLHLSARSSDTISDIAYEKLYETDDTRKVCETAADKIWEAIYKSKDLADRLTKDRIHANTALIVNAIHRYNDDGHNWKTDSASKPGSVANRLLAAAGANKDEFKDFMSVYGHDMWHYLPDLDLLRIAYILTGHPDYGPRLQHIDKSESAVVDRYSITTDAQFKTELPKVPVSILEHLQSMDVLAADPADGTDADDNDDNDNDHSSSTDSNDDDDDDDDVNHDVGKLKNEVQGGAEESKDDANMKEGDALDTSAVITASDPSDKKDHTISDSNVKTKDDQVKTMETAENVRILSKSLPTMRKTIADFAFQRAVEMASDPNNTMKAVDIVQQVNNLADEQFIAELIQIAKVVEWTMDQVKAEMPPELTDGIRFTVAEFEEIESLVNGGGIEDNDKAEKPAGDGYIYLKDLFSIPQAAKDRFPPGTTGASSLITGLMAVIAMLGHIGGIVNVKELPEYIAMVSYHLDIAREANYTRATLKEYQKRFQDVIIFAYGYGTQHSEIADIIEEQLALQNFANRDGVALTNGKMLGRTMKDLTPDPAAVENSINNAFKAVNSSMANNTMTTVNVETFRSLAQLENEKSIAVLKKEVKDMKQ